jgi:hypothetical protein
MVGDPGIDTFKKLDTCFRYFLAELRLEPRALCLLDRHLSYPTAPKLHFYLNQMS